VQSGTEMLTARGGTNSPGPAPARGRRRRSLGLRAFASGRASSRSRWPARRSHLTQAVDRCGNPRRKRPETSRTRPHRAELQAIATELAAAEALANASGASASRSRTTWTAYVRRSRGRVLAVNDSFCQIVGRSREEIVDKGAAPFTHPKEVRRPAVAKADQIRYFDRYLKQGGRAIDVEVSKSFGTRRVGGDALLRHSVRDVTEEQALRAPILPPGAA